jgi:hypothetical protein
MKVSVDTLNKHIGDVVKITSETPEEINGVYQIIDVEPGVEILYNFKDGFILETSLDKSNTINSVYMDINERLDLLYEGYLKLSIQLINEGWEYSEDPAFEGLNIMPVLNKLKALKILREINTGDVEEMGMGGIYA